MQKRYTLILLFCGLSFFIQAQDKLSLSLQHLSQNEKKYHLNQEDLESFKLVHEASLQKSGATTLYLQQTLDGIEIQNAMLVVTLDKFGKVVHVGNSAISQLKSIEKIDEAKMKMDEAAVFAAKHLGVLRPETPTIAQRSEDGFGVLRQTSYTKQKTFSEQKQSVITEKQLKNGNSVKYTPNSIMVVDLINLFVKQTTKIKRAYIAHKATIKLIQKQSVNSQDYPTKTVSKYTRTT